MELARIAGASVDELRYMERKGFVNPVRTRLQQREVRQYQDADVRKVQLIIKYRRQGFTWDVAFQNAQRELANPPLFERDNWLWGSGNRGEATGGKLWPR